MSQTWVSRVGVGLLVLLAGAPVASAAPPEPETFIDISLDAPAELGNVVELRLLRDGTDVTGTLCERPADAADAPSDVRWRCTDVPDGAYTIEAEGLRDDDLMYVQCVDALVSGPELAEMLIDRSQSRLAYGCTVFVGRPAVLLSVAAFGGPIPSGVDLELTGVDGLDGVTCAPSTVNVDHPATRCEGLPLGDYTPEVVGETLTEIVFCGPLFQGTFIGSELDGTANLTAENWLWGCDLAAPDPNATVRVEGDIADANNFDGPFSVDVSAATPVVTGPNGDVGAACQPGSFVAPYRVVYDCYLLPGTYTVEWEGLPDAEFEPDCTEFAVSASSGDTVAGCTLAWQQATPTTAPPTDTLPETGGRTTGTATAGALALLAGVTLLAWARRPRPAP